MSDLSLGTGGPRGRAAGGWNGAGAARQHRREPAWSEAGPEPAATDAPGSLNRLVHVTAALVSVALVAGVGLWGWQLAVRDVSGVPVVVALEGPMRIAPDDPGGMQAAYQGLAVNAVAAGAPAVVPERIVLAPAPPALDQPAPGNGARATPGLTEAVLRRDVTDDDDAEDPPGTSYSGAGGAAIPASVPGVSRSPVPPRRPAHDLVAETAARAVLQSLSPGATVEVDPDTLTSGTRLVQLGAYDDAAAAREDWNALVARFGAHMEGKGRVIQPAEAGGRTFYRLRAQGFSDEAEARRFCAVLVHEDATCIPVLIR